MEATARTSHHGLAPKERGLPPVQCPFIARTPIKASAARRARAASLRVSPPPERQPAQWRSFACHANAGCVMEATARTSHHGLAPKERGLPPVQCPFIAAYADRSQRGTARACGKLACFATSRETASAVALVRVPRDSRLRVGGHSSHVAPRSCTEGERPSAGAVPFRSAYADRSQRGTARARGKLACFATSRETASAVALARVPRECRLRVGGHSSHVAPRSCTEGERPSAGAVPFRSAYADHNQRGTACARGKLACFATSRETASAVALVRVPRECRLRVGGHSSHVAPRSCTEGERSSAGAVPFHSSYADQSQRGTACARGKLACFATSRETASAVALVRVHATAGCVMEATARTSHHGLAPKERGLPPVQCPFIARTPIKPARHGVRVRQACVFRHLPRDSQRSGARSRSTRQPAA